ncbi:uncharacterized protein LOC101221005 [Cucumis sativus]|uniref:uncharacterized protein LOC101221005 n=1 Tax=Cucumis sativus TaxID=3659 RepID=UPI0012F4C83F|nr:uncharacterized protein LOC101221005 [Cucumis sativus]
MAFSEEILMATPVPSYPFPHFSPSLSSLFGQTPPISMDPINPSLHQSSPSTDEALDLLELFWFFDNLLLRRNPKMLISRSDPCLSKLPHQVFVETPPTNLCSSPLDAALSLHNNGGAVRRNLLRTPSLPSRMYRGQGIPEERNDSRPLLEHCVLVETPVHNVCSSSLDMDVSTANLLRTPSLPPRVDQEEGNGSGPLSEHGVFAEPPADHACLSTLDMPFSPGNSGDKRRSLRRMPSLPSRVEREQGIQEKGNGSKPLIEHALLQKPAKPPSVERKEEGIRSKESGSTRRSKSARKPPQSNLLRTPSLPPCIGREREFGEREAAARIRNSIQPNLSEFFPTRQEFLEKKFSLPMCRIPTSSDEMWHQFLIQMRKRRSQSELESEELQGFKDLGFTFDKKDINPTVVDIIPGLREKKEEELESERTRRPYLSEAWMLQTHLLPPIPKWDNRKSAEDMKQQIKFWARAVASNVHLPKTKWNWIGVQMNLTLSEKVVALKTGPNDPLAFIKRKREKGTFWQSEEKFFFFSYPISQLCRHSKAINPPKPHKPYPLSSIKHPQMWHTQNLLSSNFPLFTLSPPTYNHKLFLSPPTTLSSLHRPITFHSVSPLTNHRCFCLPQFTDLADATFLDDNGPVELPPTIFATTDDPSSLQVATSVLLTGAISVFLFRSLRRRAKRVKELKFRSGGVKKSLKEEAMDSLKAISTGPIESKSTPSPIQAFLGAIAAGVIALILYKFTTTIEASLNRQTVSDNFSVRQLTITIRTIVNGLCYLATFVFGINAIGLFLYSGQLAMNSVMEEGSKDTEPKAKSDEQVSPPTSTAETTLDSTESSNSKDDQSSSNL